MVKMGLIGRKMPFILGVLDPAAGSARAEQDFYRHGLTKRLRRTQPLRSGLPWSTTAACLPKGFQRARNFGFLHHNSRRRCHSSWMGPLFTRWAGNVDQVYFPSVSHEEVPDTMSFDFASSSKASCSYKYHLLLCGNTMHSSFDMYFFANTARLFS